jgi:hypothetical protein
MGIPVQKMQSRDDLEKLQISLWGRYLSNRAVHGETASLPADSYEGICKDLEK